MQVNYAATGGDNATTLTLLWWLEGGAVNRVPLVQPSPRGRADGHRGADALAGRGHE